MKIKFNLFTKLILIVVASSALLVACGKSREEIIKETADCMNKGTKREVCARQTGANEEELSKATDISWNTRTDFSKWHFPPSGSWSVNPFSDPPKKEKTK